MVLRGSIPSTMSGATHTFSRAPQASIPRSKFNRSFGHKTTFDEGYLVPVLVDEMLPGDTFNLKMTAFARLATPIFPIMDNMYLESFFFSVPYRLVWDNWEKFNGYQVNPGDSTDFLVPQFVLGTGAVVTGELADYFGIPTNVTNLSFNSLHFRAYNLIYNEWFRDENQQQSVPVSLGDGPDTYTDYKLLRRGKRWDYFTSCLPFPQKGPDVEVPLGVVPVTPITPGVSTPTWNWAGAPTGPSVMRFLSSAGGGSASGYPNWFPSTTGPATGSADAFWVDPQLQVDLTDAAAFTIDKLRVAFQTQKLYERDARGGTRYTEIIKSHFGVQSPDMRLQRPEFLGGGSTTVNINPIAQTTPSASPTTTDTLGNLAAFGTVSVHGHGFTYSATEHCLIIGLVSVRADLNYQQGLDRMWSRRTRFDYYWPAFSHLGEQAVLNQEIFAQGTVDDTGVFGYQERYAEYRYKASMATGLFRSNAIGTLDAWHLAQDFATLPVLGDEFIVEDAPMARIKAVPAEPDFIMDAFFSYHCVRPMPVWAVPGLVDHF